MLLGLTFTTTADLVDLAALIVAIGALVGGLALLAHDLRSYRPNAHIVPYFRELIRGSECYPHGHAIARHCQQLDQLAQRLGMRSLSSFGFADDMRGETITWHPTGAGLDTVGALLDSANELELAADQRDLVVADLRRYEAALRKADTPGVDFCLVLLTSNMTNQQEHDQREGSFS